ELCCLIQRTTTVTELYTFPTRRSSDLVRVAEDKGRNRPVDNYEEEDLEKTRMFEAVDEDDYKETHLNENEEIIIRGGSNEGQDAKRLRRENVNRRNED